MSCCTHACRYCPERTSVPKFAKWSSKNRGAGAREKHAAGAAPKAAESQGDAAEEVDYQKLIQEAVAVGDLKRVAALSELAKKQQLEKKKKATDETIQRVQRIAALKLSE